MPIAAFEREVLTLLAAHRSPDSFVGGATVIHADSGSPRYSRDLDIFHDTADSVARCASADLETLRADG